MKLCLFALLLISNVFAAGKIEADVELFPAGDFTAKSTQVQGHMVKKDGKLLLGTPIKVAVKSFDTGIDLRNEHTANYLSSKGKHPVIVVSKGMGKDGKGVVLMAVNGKSKKVPFTYKEKGSTVAAEFDIKLSDFGIEGISYKGIGVEDEVKVKALIPLK